jgi:hypothetical protein
MPRISQLPATKLADISVINPPQKEIIPTSTSCLDNDRTNQLSLPATKVADVDKPSQKEINPELYYELASVRQELLIIGVYTEYRDFSDEDELIMEISRLQHLYAQKVEEWQSDIQERYMLSISKKQ